MATIGQFSYSLAESPVVRRCGSILREAIMRPVVRLLCDIRVVGQEHLETARPPVILAANHVSHADTAVIWTLVPPALRQRLVTAAADDYWFQHWHRLLVASLAYGAVPFPRHGQEGVERCVALLQRGFSVLIFPEGTRSPDGQMGPFKPGVGIMAQAAGCPVVPVHLAGTFGVLPKGAYVPRRGPVRVAVGRPLVPEPDESPASLLARVQLAIEVLCGTP